ncbi:D-alpha,beta-D-heptose 1,7-bisphosphate phosphatase [Malonomonas rubra DSM 5091]|uniref:D,D-heptose 1,7-bisphosphate phosphatase n=1 Tax=Malonomonas rubra DSM 5091 TaxID=1122189 RepID=A0A1M6C6H5_MALRU|nr:D-glycero-beta-D-manno-heptose 1,7-bisphosphate 7-phosphatase [Malonomonas rubra]SHI56630.1 D-alpha,beta-D-heptose 1,7-bisphosphate phosphatase [Malonomonas rubra DSM 5091]
MASKRAVFLDRDGTINVEKDYLIDPAEFEFIPGVPEALQKLQQAGFLLVVVSNQSGVARGYFGLDDVDRLHAHMKVLLKEYGVVLAGVYICPHHPTSGVGKYKIECDCRKGEPGMLLQAARELDIDLPKSFMVGDKDADFQAGSAAGCSSILVRTGHGEKWVQKAHENNVPAVADLPAAVEKILQA